MGNMRGGPILISVAADPIRTGSMERERIHNDPEVP